MKTQKAKRSKGRPQSKILQVAITRLLEVLENNIIDSKDESWRINDIVAITAGNRRITPEKRRIAYQAIATVREIIRAKYSYLFYSVPGNGYRLLVSIDDHKLVFERWRRYSKTLMTKVIIPVCQSGKLLEPQHPEIIAGVEEIRGLLGQLSRTK